MKRLLVGIIVFFGLAHLPVYGAAGTVTINQSVSGTLTAGDVTTTKVIDSANSSYFLDPAASGNALIIAGTAGIGTISPNNKLEVLSTTTPQLRTAYSTSQYATTGVSDAGIVTMDAVGTTPGYYFPDRIGVGPNGTLNTNYDAYISNTSMNINNASANAALAIDATVAGTATGPGSNHYGIYRNLTFNGSAAGYSVAMLGDINYLINSVTTIGGASSFTNHYNLLRNDAAVSFSTIWNNNYNEFKNASTGTMTSVANNYSTMINSSTGVITSAINNFAIANNSSTGTITSLYGLYTDSPANTSGTITSAYGVYVADQSVGTNTSAYGVYIGDQAGAATNNFGVYSAGTTNYNYFGGKVGIGQTTPGQSLDVVGQVRIENLATSTSTWDVFTNDGIADCEAPTGTTGDSLCFRSSLDGGGASALRLTSAGALTIAGTATTNGNPDIAEQIEVNDPTIVPGDILVAMNPLSDDGRDIYKRAQATKSRQAYEGGVLGVVSSDPGLLIAIRDAMSLPEANRGVDGTRRSLAIAGRMPVNIAPNSERIEVGDYLTSSDIPGKAMKATRGGATIGKALEEWTPPPAGGSGKTSILMFLNVSWYDPTDTVLLGKTIEEQRRQIDQLTAINEGLKEKLRDYNEVKARVEKVETIVNGRSFY